MAISAILPDQIDAHRLLVAVEQGRTTATYRAHQQIFRQGEVAKTVFFVQEGVVEFTLTDRGIDFVLGRATEGQFFGAACLDEVAVRITSATAITNSRITSVSKDAILSAISERPRFSKLFTDHLWYNSAASKHELVGRLLEVVSEGEAAA
jgi:CRP/FNR family cyclic AMP-dependent transcriptional regulator